MIENDTWYRCNICGREGRVGRCCSDDDRTPLNALAKAEQERIKGAKNTDYKEEKMNVLILFDGMSCGQIDLKRAGIKYSNYFSSEIDK